MTHAIMKSTQVQFNLTVNVNVNADKTLLLIVACLVWFGWQINKVKRELSFLWGDFVEAFQFTSKVYVIGFKSLAFGMGVMI